MLGDIVGESSGKLVGTRILSADPQHPKVEASIQGSSKLLGTDTTDMGTYWQTVRSGGVLYGEGQVLSMTADGGIVSFTGFGVGRPTGQGFAAQFAICGSYQTTAEKLARLNGVAIVGEYEVDEQGNYHSKVWEWKAPVAAAAGAAARR